MRRSASLNLLAAAATEENGQAVVASTNIYLPLISRATIEHLASTTSHQIGSKRRARFNRRRLTMTSSTRSDRLFARASDSTRTTARSDRPPTRASARGHHGSRADVAAGHVTVWSGIYRWRSALHMPDPDQRSRDHAGTEPDRGRGGIRSSTHPSSLASGDMTRSEPDF